MLSSWSEVLPMAGRKRRPAISPQERAAWLEQLDSGRGVTAISRASSRDIRVVKRHLAVAQQERDVGRARQDLIRKRLEQHQEDLLAEAGRLRTILGVSTTRSLEPKEELKAKLHGAFREHVRLARLGRLLREYDTATVEYLDCLASLQSKLGKKETEVVSSLPSAIAMNPWLPPLMEGIVGCAWHGRFTEHSYVAEKAEDKGVIGYMPCWGGHHLTNAPVGKADIAKFEEAHLRLCEAAQSLVPELQPHSDRLKALAREIKDELDVFLLKRLVQGRCRYCPA